MCKICMSSMINWREGEGGREGGGERKRERERGTITTQQLDSKFILTNGDHIKIYWAQDLDI